MEFISLKGIVNIFPFQNSKELVLTILKKDNEELEEFENNVLEQLPKMKRLVEYYENKWNKKMKDFNIIEQDHVMKEFREKYM